MSSSNRLVTSASTEGMTAAPAMPSTARQAMSISGLVENAATTEVSPNTAAPMSSNRFRPIRSPRLPIVTRKPAIRNP